MPEVDEPLVVAVNRVHIPAWSTVGYGYGQTEDGRPVEFIGDHRPMRHLGEALSLAEKPVLTSIEPWQITRLDPALSN